MSGLGRVGAGTGLGGNRCGLRRGFLLSGWGSFGAGFSAEGYGDGDDCVEALGRQLSV